MIFWVLYLAMALSCIAITGTTLVAYTDCALWLEISVWLLLFFSWFSPIFIWSLQAKYGNGNRLYNLFALSGYFLFGWAFLFVMTIIFRDLLWTILYQLSGKNIAGPNNFRILNAVNIATVSAVFAVCFYGIWGVMKKPRVKIYKYKDRRILQPLRLLLVSDMHITGQISVEKVREWVSLINEQRADIILLPGDIADDYEANINKQIAALGKIKTSKGIYYTLGNHEFYFNGAGWEAKFASLGWVVLHNSGVEIAESGVYIGGVPDINAFAISISQAFRGADKNNYRILLSHTPNISKKADFNLIDLLVSGHTHGGQMFPFNIFTKLGNGGLVSGEYQKGNTTILVSNGLGYWGPPIRLGVPSDVVIIELSGE